jgi:flagellar basal-body rod protein FlgB
LERLLDFQLSRHSVLASNLANAETPGFKPQDLIFENTLAAVSELPGTTTPDTPVTTDSRHLIGEALPPGTTLVEDESALGPDQNGVQIERVMAQITANRLRYETGIELTRRRMALLRYASTDGAG